MERETSGVLFFFSKVFFSLGFTIASPSSLGGLENGQCRSAAAVVGVPCTTAVFERTKKKDETNSGCEIGKFLETRS